MKQGTPHSTTCPLISLSLRRFPIQKQTIQNSNLTCQPPPRFLSSFRQQNGHTFPSLVPEDVQKEIIDYCFDCVKALGFYKGACVCVCLCAYISARERSQNVRNGERKGCVCCV